jgi:hypothetical protein
MTVRIEAAGETPTCRVGGIPRPSLMGRAVEGGPIRGGLEGFLSSCEDGLIRAVFEA